MEIRPRRTRNGSDEPEGEVGFKSVMQALLVVAAVIMGIIIVATIVLAIDRGCVDSKQFIVNTSI